MHLTLYNYTGEKIRVDKTNYLTNALAIEGEVPATNQNVETPQIYVKFISEPQYNYAQITEYHRYYWITDRIWMGGDVWMLQLRVDVDYTYRAFIANQEGIVEYSRYGNYRKLDKRIAFNTQPVVYKTPLTTVDTTAKYVMMRYLNLSDPSWVGNEVRNNGVSCVYMTTQCYKKFIDDLSALPDDDRKFVSSCIIDITAVHYIPYLSPATAYQQFVSIRFKTITDQLLMTLYNNSAHPESPSTNDHMFIINDTQNIGREEPQSWNSPYVNFAFPVSAQYWWEINAEYDIYIPFVGNVSFDLANCGRIPSATTVYIGLKLKHEPLENAYVLTPWIGYMDGNGVLQSEDMVDMEQVVPVDTTCVISADTAYSGINERQSATAINALAGLVVGGALMSVNPVIGIMSAARSTASLANDLISLETARKQERLAFSQKGLVGGAPAYVHDTNYVTLFKKVIPPAYGYEDLWTTYGVPDGAFRSLSAMTGYVKMLNVILDRLTTATETELNEIYAHLISGVIL